MATGLFEGEGALSDEEVNSVFKLHYSPVGRATYKTKIVLGDEINPIVESMVNEHGQNLSHFIDRLIQTIAKDRGYTPNGS